jgi:aminopeptidase N
MRILFFGLVLILFSNCITSKKTSNPDIPVIVAPPMEELEITEETNTLSPDAKSENKYPYRATSERKFDLIHTELDVRFDIPKERLLGKAILTLKPVFYSQKELVLDAKNFDLHSITVNKSKVDYTYDSLQIFIKLPKICLPEEQIEVAINYTAKPAERKTGGSDAIKSDQGLYFVNPRGDQKEMPVQIWTQGETESNSCWFPTIDKPNDRCTQEISITIEDKFKTLSNGLMVASKKNNDGTRTDRWKMDKPHAPYLFMMAIGEYAVVKDNWRDKDLKYFVEPKFESSAKHIFNHTPEMLEFFSNKLKVPYPWQKYDQVIVRNFVSGAMENTTAVIFGEFVQKDSIECKESPNDYIVAHEMFHHWFGDYVTCESWSNLTLNEGFANYSEYLWPEYKYGKAKAEEHLLEERQGYFSSAQGGVHPLIHFHYGSREEMFDAHSYNKGGQVLHMLRTEVGEDAFWAALNLYLTRNAYKAVEVDDLRLAFEEVTGRDLNWFFNQWYLQEGHPVLDIMHEYQDEHKRVAITVKQKQSERGYPSVFILPTNIEIVSKTGSKATHQLVFDSLSQTKYISLGEKPQFVNFDKDKVLLSENTFHYFEDDYIALYKNGSTVMDRISALENLSSTGSSKFQEVANLAINDKSDLIRAIALNSLGNESLKSATLVKLLETDQSHEVRSVALGKLGVIPDGKLEAIRLSKKALSDKNSYSLMGQALTILQSLEPLEVGKYANELESSTNQDLLISIGNLYKTETTKDKLPFYFKALDKMDGFKIFNLVESICSYATSAQAENDITTKFIEVAKNQSASEWRRIASFSGLRKIKDNLKKKLSSVKTSENRVLINGEINKIMSAMTEIESKETKEELKAIMTNLLAEPE